VKSTHKLHFIIRNGVKGVSNKTPKWSLTAAISTLFPVKKTAGKLGFIIAVFIKVGTAATTQHFQLFQPPSFKQLFLDNYCSDHHDPLTKYNLFYGAQGMQV
jgi:hypothetical protein